jgi:hypothetical protein
LSTSCDNAVILSSCYKVVTIVELQDDNKLLEQLVTSLLSSLVEQAVRTHPVDKLLEQHSYKSAAGLLQRVRFYVCNTLPYIMVFTAPLGRTV